MQLKNIAIFSLLIILSVSCNHTFKEYDKKSFSTYAWSDDQEITFKPEIKDINKKYQVIVGVRHHFALNLDKFNMKVAITSPSGKQNAIDYDLKIKDGGNNVGSCAGDICDLEAVIYPEIKFEEAGTYVVTLTHNEQGYKIPGVLEVGLIIDEKE